LIVGRDTIAVPVDVDLLTGGIELGFAFLVGQVEGDNLVPDEVLSWSEILGKSSVVNGPGHQLFLNPVTAVVLASLINLEPLGSPGVEFVAGRRPARGQVSHHRTHIVRPGAKALCPPVPGELTAGHGIGDKVSVAHSIIVRIHDL
jgi:hypothetical protein